MRGMMWQGQPVSLMSLSFFQVILAGKHGCSESGLTGVSWVGSSSSHQKHKNACPITSTMIRRALEKRPQTAHWGWEEKCCHPHTLYPEITFCVCFLDGLIMLNEFHKLVIWWQCHSIRTLESLSYPCENCITLKLTQQQFARSLLLLYISGGRGELFFFPLFFLTPPPINNLCRCSHRPRSLWKCRINIVLCQKMSWVKHRTQNKTSNWTS